MNIRMKEYKQLDSTTKNQVSYVGEGILRRFDKTEFPTEETDVVCPHFMLLAWSNGCPYNCAWCFLKGTFRFRGQHENGRVPQIFKERERVEKHLQTLLKAKELPGEIINTGELSDSLMDEGTRLKETFSEFIMRQFKGSKHRVLFLTKSTNVERFLVNNWQRNAILAWSVNAPAVSKRWEIYAPTPEERLAAACKVKEKGYEVRLRIDPVVPIEDWEKAYSDLVDLIGRCFVPDRVTLGTLRGLTTTIIYAKDKTWTTYLTEKSNWGKKPPFGQRLAMYELVTAKLKKIGVKDVGVCKETLAMHKALGSVPSKIKCNCVS